MTQDIPRSKWSEFLNDLSKRRFEWQTKIEVISQSIGDQILDEGLSLNGFAVEENDRGVSIGIIVGHDAEHHQTHNIVNPTAVRYLAEEQETSGVLEIEEKDGTKTLVYIVKPMPISSSYTESKPMKAS